MSIEPDRVAIVIPTRDRASELHTTLGHLAAVLESGVEIIVVSNGSRDETGGTVLDAASTYPTIRLVETPTVGASAARNLGAGSTTAEVLVFIDDDVRPAPGWIDALMAPILSGAADAVVGAVELDEGAPDGTPAHIRAMYVATADAMDPAHPFFTGCNSAIARVAFDAVGGFDEELGPGALGAREDIFLGMKLVAAGLRMVFEPHALVVHAVPRDRFDRAPLLARAGRDGRSLGWIGHHWGGASTRALLPRYTIARAVELVAGVGGGRRPFPSQVELAMHSRCAEYLQLRTERSRTRKYPDGSAPAPVRLRDQGLEAG